MDGLVGVIGWVFVSGLLELVGWMVNWVISLGQLVLWLYGYSLFSLVFSLTF